MQLGKLHLCVRRLESSTSTANELVPVLDWDEVNGETGSSTTAAWPVAAAKLLMTVGVA